MAAPSLRPLLLRLRLPALCSLLLLLLLLRAPPLVAASNFRSLPLETRLSLDGALRLWLLPPRFLVTFACLPVLRPSLPSVPLTPLDLRLLLWPLLWLPLSLLLSLLLSVLLSLLLPLLRLLRQSLLLVLRPLRWTLRLLPEPALGSAGPRRRS